MEKAKSRVLVFGEVLWDIYPDARTIGGAPLNFASHIVRLGDRASLISAIGKDELGVEAREKIQAMGVDDAYVADTQYPTGFCAVKIKGGVSNYELSEGVAYDYIELQAIPTDFDSLYFGTLAQRNMVSRNTLQRLFQRPWKHVFFDINIRQSFYSKEIIEEGLTACNILKISREEADIFERVGLSQVSREDCIGEDAYLKALACDIADTYNIENVLITLDADGAMAYDGEEFFYAENPPCQVVSTVGGGDSFFACFAHFKMKGFGVAECLKKAVILSCYVVSHIESIPQYSRDLKKELQIDQKAP